LTVGPKADRKITVPKTLRERENFISGKKHPKKSTHQAKGGGG